MTARIATIFIQEFSLARRNLWVLLATIVLALFALALAFFGAGQGVALDADILTLTSASLATLSVYLIPLIALLMSYDSFAGEIERGALALTLATPVRRWEVFVAKFLAQGAAVGVSIMLAYAITGFAVLPLYGAGPEGIAAWLRLIASSVLLGAVFVAVGLALSALSSRTARAAALAIGTWLVLVVLYDLALLGAIMASGEGTFASHVFPWLVIANPADAFRLYNLASLDSVPVAGIDGLARTLPFPPGAAIGALALWLVTTVSLGIARTKRIVP
ncbi:ABC transporter permease [Tropicimonas sp. IMCC6043]|uniref:ABC transporter permease n=1 Tax=Tropicimonas sp. IMCC6043 TaxID=2510645 RepID=UPI00101B8C74|nr:ABC transporter permease subunit [Tropicimonas sp. IMCC6043]RYH10429.1 nitrous oxidase accessory protein [Tropicimonas sp. IMCC6043]